MAPLQMSKNFKFKPIYPLPSLPQNGASSFSSLKYYGYVFPNEKSLVVVFDEAWEDLFKQNAKKKIKLYNGSRKFQDAWIPCLPF